MYACVRVCAHAYAHACMSVSMHVSHASTVVLSNIYGEAIYILHKYVICKKHTSQSKVICKNMFVCLYGCLSQSLPCPLVFSYVSVILMWFVWLVDVPWVLLCVWYLCVVYVKSNNNVHTKPKEYNYFDILVGGEGLWSSFVLRLLHLQSGGHPDDLLFHCEKAIHDMTDCGLVFYTPVFRRDVLWYGAVRPSVCPSVRPSVRLLARKNIEGPVRFFSNSLWRCA